MKRLFVKIELGRPRCWRDKAINAPAFDLWDRAWRRRMGWLAGLKFWSQTNVPGSRVLLSRHWPHLLCWSWSIWVGRRRKGFDGPRRFALIVSRRYRHAVIEVFGPHLRVDWQDYGYMPDTKFKNEAPKVEWAK